MATKDELKAELDALNVAYPADASKADLEAMLAEAKPAETETGDDTLANPAAEAPKGKKTEAEVLGRTNQVVRVFSKDVHGADFEKIAHEFADRRGCTVRLR